MFLRALLAFLVLPGVVAFAVPVAIASYIGATPRYGLLSLTILGLGVAGLLWCVRDFYVAGKGTLAPWAPPVHLVRIGLYRMSRNPMYVSVILILTGWAILFESLAIAGYAAAVAIAFHIRILVSEEPALDKAHSDEWREYRRMVPRWLGLGGSTKRAPRTKHERRH
jgi:protein-S-isoprenylcysteine O-methyltransferase Ste14